MNNIDTSRIAMAIWPWGTSTKEQMETAAKEISEIGFKGFESVQHAIYAYDMDLNAYKDVLKRYDITPVSFYFHIPRTDEEKAKMFSSLDRELEFVANLGTTHICLQGQGGRPELMDEARKAEQLEIITKVAKAAKKHGICAGIHPHYNSWIMYEDEIDYMMQNSDRDTLFFTPDTAHMIASLCDPVEVIKRYADRIKFTHFKDIGAEGLRYDGDASCGPEVYSNFRELGEGCVDLKGCFDVLKEAGYDGPLCIELDKAPISNAISAKKCYDYIKNNY